MLSDWDKGILFGLTAEKCPSFLVNYGDLLDDSYFQYYLLYRAYKGLYSKRINGLSSVELKEEVTLILKGEQC